VLRGPTMRVAPVQHLRGHPTPRVEFSSLHETLIIASAATVLVERGGPDAAGGD